MRSTVDLEKRGFELHGSIYVQIFFFYKYGTTFLIHGWLYPWVQNLHGLQYLQILVSIAGPGTSVPHIPRDDYSCINLKFYQHSILSTLNFPTREHRIVSVCLYLQFLSAKLCNFHSISFVLLLLNVF